MVFLKTESMSFFKMSKTETLLNVHRRISVDPIPSKTVVTGEKCI